MYMIVHSLEGTGDVKAFLRFVSLQVLVLSYVHLLVSGDAEEHNLHRLTLQQRLHKLRAQQMHEYCLVELVREKRADPDEVNESVERDPEHPRVALHDARRCDEEAVVCILTHATLVRENCKINRKVHF